MKPLVVASVVLTLSASIAAAQSSSKASPADVARDFFAAERDGRWLDAAHLVDLKSFEPQRTQAVANARHARDARQFHLTVDQILRHDPSMPRAAAEYQVKQAKEAFRDFNPLAFEYADVPTADSLAALTVDVAAARWLEAKDPRWMMKRQMKMEPHSFLGECAKVYDSVLKTTKVLDEASVAASILTPPHREVIAVATVGPTAGYADSSAYVLSREKYENRSDSAASSLMAKQQLEMSPSVLTMIRTPAGWRVLPVLDFGNTNGFASIGFDCAVDSGKPPVKKK